MEERAPTRCHGLNAYVAWARIAPDAQRAPPNRPATVTQTPEQILASLPPRPIDVPRRWAEVAPDAPAVYAGDRRWSYGELASAIDTARSALSEAGVRPGDRVVLVIENCFAAVCFFYAVTALDAWAVMANARLTPREVDVIRESADARLIVYTVGDSPDAARHAEGASAVDVEDAVFGRVAFGPVNDRAEVERIDDDPARKIGAMIFTSGTTGRPKGAMLSHRTMLYQSATVAQRRRFRAGDCPYVVAPMVHIFGLAGMFLPVMYGGAAMELASRFSVDDVVAALGRGHLTHLYGAPPMFAALLAHSVETGRPIEAPRLKEILAGGAPLDPELRRGVEKAFGMTLGHGYAATEFSPIATTTPDEPGNDGAAGRPAFGIEIKLVDEAGEEVPRGEVGEVWCRGPNRMSGYYRDPEATAAIFRPGGWIAIGDLAFFDDDGQIHLVGRLKDMIIRSGFNVYPAEVEAVLNSHPSVLQSAVVGRAVPGNEEVIAFVQAAPGHDLDVGSVARHAADGLAPYKRPARIVPLDALPVGPTGKLAKTALREMAATLG